MIRTIGAEDVDKKLREKYGDNEPSVPRTKIVDNLYSKYLNKLSRPVLNVNNLTIAVRYIRKHNVPENDFKKVIKLLSSHNTALTKNDFSNIYKYVIKNGSDRGCLTYKNAKKADSRFVDMIINAVINGDKVRIPGLGTFKRQYSKARHYSNPNGSGVTKAHYRPVFRASSNLKHKVAGNN